jgi:pre-mRNA-processing factor 39
MYKMWIFSGNFDAAFEVLATLEKSVPGLIMLAMRRISLERRRGNLGDVETFFKKYIEDAASPEIASFYSIKYARFLLKAKPFKLLYSSNLKYSEISQKLSNL